LADWVSEVERVDAWVYGDAERLGGAVGTSEGRGYWRPRALSRLESG